MVYFSRDDLETIANRIIEQYKHAFVPERYLCYQVDPTQLASLLGFHIEYVNITKDGSILGQTSSGSIWVPIIGPDQQEILYLLDGKTILVEERLLLSQNCIGRKNFTIAHELAHQILNQGFTQAYGSQCRTFCDYRRSSAKHKKISDWYEWQADALAAALLLPKDALLDSMFLFGLGDKMKVLSKKYSPNNYERFCNMAECLQVSKTALSYRMEQLGLLERNYLLKEATRQKGVA